MIKHFVHALKRLCREDDGPTSIEYAIMAALIAGVVVASAQLLGGNANALLENTAAIFSGL